MPAYKGNVFRGRFGYILRHVAVSGRTGSVNSVKYVAFYIKDKTQAYRSVESNIAS